VPASDQLYWIYLAGALAVGVILAALLAALFIYQRLNLKLHQTYAKKLLDAHEEERAWVAREVHDDALQRVAILQHELSEWDSGEPSVGDGPERASMRVDALRIDALRSELQDLGVMLRRVAHRLHPAIIDQGGLLPALDQLSSDVSRASGIDVETSFEDVGHASQLSRERALMLYRIAQEGLRNVSKHSGAKKARLRTRNTGGGIELSIQDFGQGFESTDPSKSAGLGLISMAERTRLADGRFEIRSTPGEGTTIRVTVPVKG
jgi:signal transduction histidine kinase